MTTPVVTGVTAPPAHLHDAGFTMPERVPWSALGPQFATVFGRSNPDDPQPEHIEIFGQNGSGKTHLTGKIYQERALVYQGSRTHILMASKPADKTLLKIGWPIVGSFDELARKVRDGHRAIIFWPRTNRMGSARRGWHEAKFTDLLNNLWVPESDTDIVVDDWGYTDTLPEVKVMLEQYLREGRSSGISVGGLKQRPQGSTRLMSSETHWTVAFAPKDRSDLERWAELFGARRDWMPVFDSLDPMKREFVIRHNLSKAAYISWVDEPLAPVEMPRHRRTVQEVIGLRRRTA